MARTFTDLLLVPAAEWQVDDDAFLAHPPAVGLLDGDAQSLDLGGGVSLEFIEDARDFMDACESRGENFNPARQHDQRYTFVRRNAPESPRRWDGDDALMACVALSRLVRANSADTHYAARIEESPGQERVVEPVNGGFRAWVAREDRRPWLDVADAESLAALHARWLSVRAGLGERVRHALWLCDYGFRIQFVDVALPHYVTALEALLNTDEHGSGRQFRERVPQLAEAVGLDLDEAFCRRIWKGRSKAAHGGQVDLGDHPAAVADLDALQSVLRFALRRSIEDEAFCDYFANASAVRERFPLSAPSS